MQAPCDIQSKLAKERNLASNPILEKYLSTVKSGFGNRSEAYAELDRNKSEAIYGSVAHFQSTSCMN